MNKDAEAIQRLFEWLLEDQPATAQPSGLGSLGWHDDWRDDQPSRIETPWTQFSETAELHLHTPVSSDWVDDAIDQLEGQMWEAIAAPIQAADEPVPPSTVLENQQLDQLDQQTDVFLEKISLMAMGDRPAVQDRFYHLLKHRLRAEIEHRPPLFPWESEGFDLVTEYSDWVAPDRVPSQLWAAQLQKLSLPALPGEVLATLFSQCQSVLQFSLREGEKLVRAVEGLFPGEAPALNQLAEMVLTPSYRDGVLMRSPDAATVPSIQYESASPQQQMALSLLAAKEILEALTLPVSLASPNVERQWQTSKGTLFLSAAYHPQFNQIQIQAEFPCAGAIEVRGMQSSSTATCAEAGYLSVALCHPVANQTYALEVQLEGSEESGLSFVVCLMAEA
jgi:hypothetical protein